MAEQPIAASQISEIALRLIDETISSFLQIVRRDVARSANRQVYNTGDTNSPVTIEVCNFAPRSPGPAIVCDVFRRLPQRLLVREPQRIATKAQRTPYRLQRKTFLDPLFNKPPIVLADVPTAVGRRSARRMAQQSIRRRSALQLTLPRYFELLVRYH